VITAPSTEGLLRELAPRVLGAVVRRYDDFADAEDAVQEALLAAATTWTTGGEPDNPLAWLIRVACHRMVDQYRRADARRRREDLAASWSPACPDPASGRDATLILMVMCCHPFLTPASAIPLTLRAVGGLSTREIATAFLVPKATMAERISRAKAKVKGSDEPFTLPSPDQRAERLRLVLHVLYLLFNEGYASSSGPDPARTDLSGEAIRLARDVRAAVPEDLRWPACSPSCCSSTPDAVLAPVPTANWSPSPSRTAPCGDRVSSPRAWPSSPSRRRCSRDR
jgi:RNA polymerase sigma factor (sigma-70 family)